MEGAVVRGKRAPGEADSSTEELAALVERNSSPLPIPPGHSLNTIDFAAPAGAEACECVIGPTYLRRTPQLSRRGRLLRRLPLKAVKVGPGRLQRVVRHGGPYDRRPPNSSA